MKVIFLDIDGVLNVIPHGRDKYGAGFLPHFVDNLKKIIDATGAKIVISSTWRFSGLQEMKNMWEDRKLPGEMIGITPYIKSKEENGLYKAVPRGEEIQQWIEEHKTLLTNYVILDDDRDMLNAQKQNFVHTHKNNDHPDCVDDGFGLTNICTEKAIKILNN